MEAWQGHAGGQPAQELKRIYIDRDRAMAQGQAFASPKMGGFALSVGLLEGDADEAVGALLDALLRNRRAQDVAQGPPCRCRSGRALTGEGGPSLWLCDRLVTVTRRGMRCNGRAGSDVAAASVLALGLGLVGAMFALADPFVLRSLPYRQTDQLALIQISALSNGVGRAGRAMTTLATLRSRRDLFSDLAAYRITAAVRARTAAGTSLLRTAEVSGNLLDVLGVPPPGVLRPAKAGIVPLVLTSRSARRAFGAATSAVGGVGSLGDGRQFEIVAVLPEGFLFPTNQNAAPTDALVFIDQTLFLDRQTTPDNRTVPLGDLTIIARLRSKVTPELVRSRLAQDLPAGAWLKVQALTTFMRRGLTPVASAGVAAAALILALCAGNLANLLLLRGIYRGPELAVRVVLGATRWHLARLLLWEVSAFTLPALALGVVFAKLVIVVAGWVMPTEYALLGAPEINVRVLVFLALMTLLVVSVTALPVAAVSAVAPTLLIRKDTVREPRNVRTLRLGAVLLQSALATLALVCAVVLVRSSIGLAAQDRGADGTVAVLTTLYPEETKGGVLEATIDRTLERIKGLAGVELAAASTGPLVNRMRVIQQVDVRGQEFVVTPKYVSPDYFRVMQNTLLSGRLLSAEDSGRSKVVVSESLAKQGWPGTTAIGQLITASGIAKEIVGVVRDTFEVSLDSPHELTLFSLLENPEGCHGDCNFVHYSVRLSRSGESAMALATMAISAEDPNAVLVKGGSLDSRLYDSIRDRSFSTAMLALFSVAGLAVCAAGIAGVVSFGVARRRRELAIRSALGARGGTLVALAMSEAASGALAGIALGLCVGYAAVAQMRHLVFGIAFGELTTLGLPCAAMVTLTMIAAALPAATALRLSTWEALRVE